MNKQSKRLARQHAKGMLDYSASERCIAEIPERMGRAAARKVVKRILEKPKPELGRLVPPHRSGGGTPIYIDMTPTQWPWPKEK